MAVEPARAATNEKKWQMAFAFKVISNCPTDRDRSCYSCEKSAELTFPHLSWYCWLVLLS